jgi:hypothetical protein
VATLRQGHTLLRLDTLPVILLVPPQVMLLLPLLAILLGIPLATQRVLHQRPTCTRVHRARAFHRFRQKPLQLMLHREAAIHMRTSTLLPQGQIHNLAVGAA